MAYSPLVNSSSVRSTTVSLMPFGADVGERRRDLAQVVARAEVDVDRVVAGVTVELDRDVRAVVGLGQLGDRRSCRSHSARRAAHRPHAVLPMPPAVASRGRGAAPSSYPVIAPPVGRVMGVLEALMRQRHVGERGEERHVVGRHAVAELTVGAVLELLTEEEARRHAQLDVDDFVAQTATVREAGVVAADDAERVLGRSRRDGHVEAQHLARRDVRRLVESRHAGQEDGDEVLAIRFRHLHQRIAVEQVEQLGDLGIGDRAQELGIIARGGRS